MGPLWIPGCASQRVRPNLFSARGPQDLRAGAEGGRGRADVVDQDGTAAGQRRRANHKGVSNVGASLLSIKMDLRLRCSLAMDRLRDHRQANLAAQRLGEQASLIIAALPLTAGMQRNRHQAVSLKQGMRPGPRHQSPQRFGQMASSLVLERVDSRAQRPLEQRG